MIFRFDSLLLSCSSATRYAMKLTMISGNLYVFCGAIDDFWKDARAKWFDLISLWKDFEDFAEFCSLSEKKVYAF